MKINMLAANEYLKTLARMEKGEILMSNMTDEDFFSKPHYFEVYCKLYREAKALYPLVKDFSGLHQMALEMGLSRSIFSEPNRNIKIN